jgi:hypothetical protein
MTSTEKRVRDFLADTNHMELDTKSISPYNGFDRMIIRRVFVTTKGNCISIQQSASHHCDENSVEMWQCPHRPILDEYGDGESPYAYVPIEVVAKYIDELESEEA